MSAPPPENLNDWGKKALIREVERLRAILFEHAERRGGDPREASAPGAAISVGDKPGAGDTVLDARNAVLLDNMEVILVDTKADDPVAMMMVMGGRVNYSRDNTEVPFIFGPDGAAGIVTEIIALAARAQAGGQPHGIRFAKEFQKLTDERLKAMP